MPNPTQSQSRPPYAGNNNNRRNNRMPIRPQREHLINDEIRSHEVRLMDSSGSPMGVIDRNRALNMAREEGCDLVMVVANANPPVCKLIDYGKFVYDEQKRKKELEKKQRETRVDTKEFQFRPVIDQHDLEIKTRKMQEFIDSGDKCKVVIRFRGRENADPDKGKGLITRIMSMLTGAQLEQNPELNANRLIATIVKQKNAR
jgi:translation initiation factor IF-3